VDQVQVKLGFTLQNVYFFGGGGVCRNITSALDGSNVDGQR
jgi:hypothetical protein